MQNEQKIKKKRRLRSTVSIVMLQEGKNRFLGGGGRGKYGFGLTPDPIF
jgi:hypothetical protein